MKKPGKLTFTFPKITIVDRLIMLLNRKKEKVTYDIESGKEFHLVNGEIQLIDTKLSKNTIELIEVHRYLQDAWTKGLFNISVMPSGDIVSDCDIKELNK